jgi:hypothetical protein
VLIFTGILLLFGGLTPGVTGTIRSLINTTTAIRPLRAGGSIGLIAAGLIFIEGLYRYSHW